MEMGGRRQPLCRMCIHDPHAMMLHLLGRRRENLTFPKADSRSGRPVPPAMSQRKYCLNH